MKKAVDKKGRLFGVISLIDVAVILAVILIVAGVYFKFFASDSKATASKTVDVPGEITIYAIDNEYLDNLKVGDIIYSKESGAEIGTITNISVSDAMVMTQQEDGSFEKINKPGFSDVKMEVTLPCSESDGRYYASRTFEVSENLTAAMDTKYLLFSGTVTEIG